MWNELAPDLLLARVAEAEHDALASAACSPGQGDVLDALARDVAAEWRGRLARVTPLSRRVLAVPSEVMIHILADYRYRAFTRLPGMAAFLDDLRVAEWREARRVLDNLAKMDIGPPEDGDLLEPSSGAPSPRIVAPESIL